VAVASRYLGRIIPANQGRGTLIDRDGTGGAEGSYEAIPKRAKQAFGAESGGFYQY
jgi:hypothetical protein